MNQKLALLSVSDKTGLSEFSEELVKAGYTLLSTGGTMKHLQSKGIPVTSISDYTQSPEIMGGRVKTLHPKVYGGLLCRRNNEQDMEEIKQVGASPIDIVAVNLYPFAKTVANPDVKLEDAIENIDIGGPSMLRASAKNHEFVTVITDPTDYPKVIAEVKERGETSLETRKHLAVKTFNHTARYDSGIDEFLSSTIDKSNNLHLHFEGGQNLRYGENSHQTAQFYLEPKNESSVEESLATAKQHHGKEISYNNLVDADAALEGVKELWEKPAVSIIKHTNPCGYATGTTLAKAFEAAWEGDPVSAFGSVIAVSRKMDLETAQLLKGRFVEIILAPGYDDDALEFLKKKSKDLRILEIGDDVTPKDRKVYKHIIGGMLVQDRDNQLFDTWNPATKTAFPENKMDLAKFTWKACKHVKSNAIVMGYEYEPGEFMLMGMGPGQPNRIDSNLRLCQPRVRDNARRLAEAQGKDPEAFTKEVFANLVLASDAFFPFDDNVVAANEAGIKFIVQPGGSKGDPQVIETCDKYGISMVFTGTRHFRH